MDGGVNVPGCAIIPLLKSKLKASLKMRTTFPKAVTRKTRGPVYLKCISVDYDEETGRMKLPDGVFGGKTLHRTVGDEEPEDDDYGETTLAFDNEENDFTGTGSFHIKFKITSGICDDVMISALDSGSSGSGPVQIL